MCTKHFKTSIPVLAVVCVFLAAAWVCRAQPAAGANKFLGNITTRNQVRPDFMTYWNQITGENEHKWSSIEGSRDRMNWGGADAIANFAKEHNILWKFHTLIWGSQYPSWLNGLSSNEQREEIIEWYDAVAQHYPDVQMIDVVNEAYPSHAPAPFKNALGGDGSTGFDWIIESFRLARERWPNAILIYNDYNNCEYNNEVNWTVQLIEAMLAANAPVDAIGCQAHDAYMISTSTVKSNIDKLAATGLPIFITEYDIGESDDNRQKQIMEEQFTMFWNHPRIVGITYWGYIVGSTWRNGTGLLNSNGSERPALTWLKEYVKNNPNPPNDFPDLLTNGGGSTSYRLTVSTNGRGTVTRTPDEDSFSEETQVTLTAAPSEGWVFNSWSGDATGDQNPLTITVDKSVKITAVFTTENGSHDLISNGSFSSGTDSWSFNNWGGDGSGSVENGEYKITINSTGDNDYDIQAVQPGILLEQGKAYRLIFDAYASGNRNLDVNVGMPVDPYSTFLTNIIDGDTTASLTTDKQTFILDFIMEEETYDNSRVEFSAGLNSPSVYIDNVSLFEIEWSSVSTPVKAVRAEPLNIRQKGSRVIISLDNGKNSSVSLDIFDLRGNIIRSSSFKSTDEPFSAQSFVFNVSDISKGYYVIRVRSGNVVRKSRLIIN